MILIRNAEVYTPEYEGKKDVLIAGERIEWVRESIDPERVRILEQTGCQVIDGNGKKLFPGLIDRHVHITGGGGEGSFRTKAPEIQLSQMIKAGITTVVGLLGTDGISRSVENLLAKAKALKEEGISVYVCTGSYGYPSVTLTQSVQKDIAFIDEVIGVKLAVSDHRAPNISVDELIRLGSDVRTAGMISGKAGIVVLHMGDDKHGLEPVREALERTSIPIKTFQPTHVARKKHLLQQALDFAKEGGFIDITADDSGMDEVKGAWEQIYAQQVPLDRITISSDGQGSWSEYDAEGRLLRIGVSSVENLYQQLVTLVRDYGYPLEEVLPCLTSNVARALEIDAHKGYIRAGKDADLLLVNNEWQIDTVIARGQIMMKDKEVLVKGTYEN